MRWFWLFLGGLTIFAPSLGEAGFAPVIFGSGVGGGGANFLVQRTATNYDSGSTPNSFYVSIGQAFAQGAVSSSQHPEIRLSDGTTVVANQQCGSTVAWGDGSLKYAQFTWRHPQAIAASGTDTVKFYAVSGAWASSGCGGTGSNSLSTVTAQDYRMEVTISGTTYTLGLNNEINAGTRVKQLTNGPTMSAWKVWGVFRNGTAIGSADQGTLWGIFYVEVFNDSTIKIWPQLMTNRLSNSTATSFSSTAFAFKNYQGGASTKCAYSNINFAPLTIAPCVDNDIEPYYSGTGAPKVVWAFPQYTYGAGLPNTTTGFYDANIFWWYKYTTTEKSALAGTQSTGGFTYTPMDNAYVQSIGGATGWDTPGGSPFIGQLAQDDICMYLLGDFASWRATKFLTLQGLWNPVWYWDSVTGYPLNVSNNTYSNLPASNTGIGISVAATITVTGTPISGGGTTNNTTHAPGFGWMPYVYSGEPWFLEILYGLTPGMTAAEDPGTTFGRNPTFNGTQYWATYLVYSNAARGVAWDLRNAGNAAWLTPDASEMKQYTSDLLTQSRTGAFADFQAAQDSGRGGTNTFKMLDFGDVNGSNVWSPWMHDHLFSSAMMELRRGNFTTSSPFITGHNTLTTIGRAVNGCEYNAVPYRAGLAAGANSPVPPAAGSGWFSAWSDEWIGELPPFPVQLTSPCPTPGYVNGYGANNTADDYPTLLQITGEIGSSLGISGASSIASYAASAEAACAACTEAWWATQAWKRIRVPQ